MKKKSFFVITIAATCLMAGCTDLTQDNFRKNKLKPEQFFDFNTETKVNVDLDYGAYGAQTLVSIFNGVPNRTEEGELDGNLLLRLFTDENGKAVSTFDMPDYITDSIFLCTSTIGTPQLVQAELTDSTIRYKYEARQYSTDNTRTRVIDWPYSGYDNGYVHAILNWWDGSSIHSRIGDQNGLIRDCGISSNNLRSITQAFWNGNSERPYYSVDNSKHVTDSDINIVTAQDGVTVSFTFLTENTSHLNSIGYYVYPKDGCPTDFRTMHKYIIFPNTSVAGNAPYAATWGFSNKYSESDAPVSNLTTVQLLYATGIGGDGKPVFSQYFPKDMVIGFFIVKDAWTPGWSNQLSLNDSGFLYSDWGQNPGGEKAFIRMDAANYVVYGVEDSKDKSFDDIMFTVMSDQNGGITYMPQTVPDNPAPTSFETSTESFHTYCFEDLWPVRGDYDMNDVVIDHHSTAYLDGNNYVIRVVDDFTVCNRYMSAQVEDAFAVIINQRGTLELPDGAYDEKETGAIILFDDVQRHLDQTRRIIRDFKKGSLKYNDLKTDLDPFIIPLIDNDNYRSDNRREVHMPKKSGTKKLDASLLGMAQEAYFVDKDGKHPFAISVPLSVAKGLFIIPDEMKQIDTEYGQFGNWVETSGKSNKDWYKYYRYAK